MRAFKIIFFLIIFFYQFLFSQNVVPSFKKQKVVLGSSVLGITSGSIFYLNQVWYQKYNTSAFHFFNDNKEWYYLDKFGHAFTNFQTARLMMTAMDWAGYSRKKQLAIGGLSGFAYMTVIEVMDGYSDGWGFSWGDMAANAFGSALALSQKMAWNEQRIQLKYSFLKSNYSEYNPNLLGKNLGEQILKDYNGQTYWLSINPSAFMKQENKFPKWLNLAFGYGANGMINAEKNSALIYNNLGQQIQFTRYTQYYFSLDADLTRIKTKSKFLKSVFSCLNILKIPFPNLEFSEHKLKFNYY